MHFAYDDFTQDGTRRCFLFRSAEQRPSAPGFSIEVDLELLLKNHVPMQAAPLFFLNLLSEASLGEPASLDRLQLHSRRGRFQTITCGTSTTSSRKIDQEGPALTNPKACQDVQPAFRVTI
jgi:hypothetical protein